MKILLTAINAKYIHTCPAVYSLKAYAEAQGSFLPDIHIAEYTINDRYRDLLSGIVEARADVIAFSTYIWNILPVQRLIRDIRLIRGSDVTIWAGGPEASYAPEEFLKKTGANLVMLGEGEVTFLRLAEWVIEKGSSRASADLQALKDKADIPGIAYMEGGQFISTGFAMPADLTSMPFLYNDLSVFDNRILYYESSRGCPFSCAYCLSGKERGLRYRDIGMVFDELLYFLEHKVKQVKFVDRTFNASPERALAIWQFIKDHDNGITNFHFEIEADRMTEEELRLLATFRPGLIQMEIGVQSANPMTLRAVHRNTGLDSVEKLMKALTPVQNINLHLDLIAGLPFEDLDSFAISLQKVYSMRPHQLQLGFLKLLPGTELFDRQEEYGLVCSDTAPYEVLRTKWLSFEEISLLHRISDRIEEFMNSQGFRRSIIPVEKLFPDAFSMFKALAGFYRDGGFENGRPSVHQRYAIFTDFVEHTLKTHPEKTLREKEIIMDTIKLDQALHIHPNRRRQAETELDIGDGRRKYRIDYRHCSPVNGEAMVTTE